MRTNKFSLSLAVAGLLVAAGISNAAAETDGAFVGVQVGLGGVKAKTEFEAEIVEGTTTTVIPANTEKTASSFRYGIVAGYKQFFTESFGLRYYGVFDYGTESKHKVAPSPNLSATEPAAMMFNFTETAKLSTLNFSANVDALYNFVQNESLDFGIFGGLSLGYTSTTARNVSINGATDTGGYVYGDISVGGFDLGVNFGLRANIAKRHGVELYSRFGFLQQKGDNVFVMPGGAGEVTTNLKVNQPYAVGLRYVFSF